MTAAKKSPRARRSRRKPGRDARHTIYALHDGEDLDSPLTPAERLAVSIAKAGPTHHVTLTSRDLSREEIPRAWETLRKRIDRARKGKPPLAYFGTFAKGNGDGGCHAHVLTWGFIPQWLVERRIPGTGFGHFKMRRLGAPGSPVDPAVEAAAAHPAHALAEMVTRVAYVIGQHEPVFEETAHRRHLPREKNKRRFVYPSEATLERSCPQLLAALEAAKDPSVSDIQLVRGRPIFISDRKSPSKAHSNSTHKSTSSGPPTSTPEGDEDQ